MLEIGMLLGSGGLGDRSFNDSAYNGLLEAQQKYNIRFETVDFVNNEENLETTRFLAQNNYDLIIGIGYEHKENLIQVAGEFPDIKFAAIDFEAEGENIASIVYREQEGDFLIGVLAAMLTETKKVGVIGGMDIPAIQRIMTGFSQGVTYQDDSVEVVNDFAGTFSDPEIGLERALILYDQGVDVIHNAASRTGLGIIEAAKQTGKLTTGTSGDQRYMAPGNVVGNRPKRVDTAVLLVIEELYTGSFTPGIRSLGLKENGIMLGPFDESIVDDTILERLDDLKEKIIEGQITVHAE
ncbi:MAG: BMP family ABC transporter substrate-binding protein [Dehalococcoidales bacterium]|nr:MAG: BMP family ABC transporter substrate-binding protein [Dehalococcoidales bacterium]